MSCVYILQMVAYHRFLHKWNLRQMMYHRRVVSWIKFKSNTILYLDNCRQSNCRFRSDPAVRVVVFQWTNLEFGSPRSHYPVSVATSSPWRAHQPCVASVYSIFNKKEKAALLLNLNDDRVWMRVGRLPALLTIVPTKSNSGLIYNIAGRSRIYLGKRLV